MRIGILKFLLLCIAAFRIKDLNSTNSVSSITDHFRKRLPFTLLLYNTLFNFVLFLFIFCIVVGKLSMQTQFSILYKPQ